MRKLVTIGVYGFDAAAFFQALQAAGVDGVVDVRWRRGVRGAEYAFANRARLQARLAELGIAYIHQRELAPSPAVRAAQTALDAADKVAKRQRQTLSAAFQTAYTQTVLAGLDATAWAGALPAGIEVAALLCVERTPAACHRSLLAAALAAALGLEVEHLEP